MKAKNLLIVILASALLFTFFSCRGDDVGKGDGYTFVDDLGRSVTVDKPKRVAALIGSFAEIWQLAGGEVICAPDDAWTDFSLDMPEDAVNLGNTKKPSLELLLSSDPDFVLASSMTRSDLDFLEILESGGIPVAYFNVSGFDDYLRMLKICTDITGRSDLYEKNGTEIEGSIASVIESSKRRVAERGKVSVLFLRASSVSIRSKNSQGNVTGEILYDLGCENIADSDSMLLENLNIEYIYAKDPDFIFIVQSGDDYDGMQKNLQKFIEDNPLWRELGAVKGDRVIFLEKRMYNLKPNALWANAYLKLETILSGYEKNK